MYRIFNYFSILFFLIRKSSYELPRDVISLLRISYFMIGTALIYQSIDEYFISGAKKLVVFCAAVGLFEQ